MKTHVSDSSIDAFHAHKVRGWKKQAVLDYAKNNRSFTRRMLTDALNELYPPYVDGSGRMKQHFETATISGLVTPLVESGDLIESLSVMKCPVTGNPAHWLEHKDYRAGQLKLC